MNKVSRYGFRALLLLVMLVALGYTLGLERRQPLLETGFWALLVLASFLGYGAALKQLTFPKATVDLGLIGTWGAGLLCVLGGALSSLSLLRRPVLIALVEVGVVLSVVALVRSRRRQTVQTAWRFARREPLVAILTAFVFGVVAIHYLASIAEWHTNPYDDDIAYLAFLQKMLDTGTFPEPFSFRRLSALGGQIVFLGFLAPRAAMSQSHTFDRGICVILLVMLIMGYRRARSPSLLFRLVAVMFLLAVPSIAINTASYFSGVLFFIALFRTLVFLEDHRSERPWAAAIPLALLGATACTLRQNYLPVPVVMLAVSYASLAWRSQGPWAARLREPVMVALFTGLALLPYMVMAYVSNKTFLFPILMGNANPALQLKATAHTLPKELIMLIQTAIDGVPIRTLPLLFIGIALLRDTRARRPFWALGAACAVGFVAVVHSFSQSDAVNIGRYVFASLMALSLVVILEAGVQARYISWRIADLAEPGASWKIGRVLAAGGIILACVGMEILQARGSFGKTYAHYLQNIDALSMSVASTDTLPASHGVYVRTQASIPAGVPFAVLADEPYFFNFARNKIYNLDMPGYASPAPGQPFFQGSAKLADYFRSLSLRYIVFVRPDQSRYHYRRDYWLERLSDDRELWLKFTPYILDYMDNLTDLAEKYRTVYAERELVVIDLQEEKHAR